jgi:hypothetical protein
MVSITDSCGTVAFMVSFFFFCDHVWSQKRATVPHNVVSSTPRHERGSNL